MSSLNKSSHFALLGKDHNDEIFKENNLDLELNTLKEKERGRRIREAIKPEKFKEKQREDAIGSGANNWVFASDEYGRYLDPKLIKEGKKPKFAVSGKQNRYTDQSLIVYSILTLLEKQPQLYGRGIQTFVPNQIDDKIQMDVLSWVKNKNRSNTEYEKEYDIDDNVFGDLVVSNLILPRDDNKLANYLTQNEKLQNGKIEITKIARCDLDELGFFISYNNQINKNLIVFDDTKWLYTWSILGLSEDQLLKIKKKLIDKIKNISPDDVVLAVQKQFSICGVKCEDETIRKALFYYKSLLSNLRDCNTGQYTRNFYLRHTRLSNMTYEDMKKAIVKEACEQNEMVEKEDKKAKIDKKLLTFDDIKNMPIGKYHKDTTYNDVFEHFKKIKDMHSKIIDNDVKKAITQKLKEFKFKHFNFEEVAKNNSIYFERLKDQITTKNEYELSSIVDEYFASKHAEENNININLGGGNNRDNVSEEWQAKESDKQRGSETENIKQTGTKQKINNKEPSNNHGLPRNKKEKGKNCTYCHNGACIIM